MKIIGLTGGTGSGKGFVASYLKSNGAYIIDADDIAHKIILKGEPAYNEIVEFFGKGILDGEGNIIRKELGKIVFSDSEKLKVLNSCTHKYIGLTVLDEVEKAKAEPDKYGFIVYDAPLLLDTEFINNCDEVWSVFADEKTRRDRIMARDSITKEEAEKRIASQKPWSVYEAASDVVIDNSAGNDDVKKEIDKHISRVKNGLA